MARVEGKVALVTGAGSGLGRADAIALARESAKVVVTDVNEEAGRAVAAEVGGVFVKQDVRSEADWAAAIGAALSLGGLDILVNNAGIVIVSDIENTTLETYRLINAIHNEGTFLGCKFAIEAMKERGGSIINVASQSAIQGFPGVISYAAAKGAVSSLTRSVAVHCRDKGYKIRCNSIAPGQIETPLLESVVGTGVPNIGHPEDVGNLVLFLASDESRHINGAQLVIDNASSVFGGPV
ncbi:SDR family oxidoreductase [Paraburkholderia sp. BR14374]|uniref:SDR family oxidoreductase n=1 Tax=Paraburkholderia sp. BR14374 TaxID=3237007 RepID=UPI0034CEC8D1